MKLTVPYFKFIELGNQVKDMQGTIQQYWQRDKIANFHDLNGEKLKKVHHDHWALIESFCEIEPTDDGQHKHVVMEQVPDLRIVGHSNVGNYEKPKERVKLLEGKTHDEFEVALKTFMHTLVEINV